MSVDYSELSSLSSMLEETTNRIGEIAKSGDEEDEAILSLYEIERQLQTASRRLAKLLR